MSSYWGNFPSQIVSSMLGLGDNYDSLDGLSDDIPKELHSAFVDHIIHYSGDAEFETELLLDKVRDVSEKWINGFLRRHGINPSDHDYKIWYKNIPDDMAHEEAFGLMGGGPEYNELILTYIPDMLQDIGVHTDARVVLDKLIKAVQTVDDTRVTEAVQELWDAAKENIRDESDPKYWKEADWIAAMSENGCTIVRTLDDTYDVYVEGHFFESYDTESKALKGVEWMQTVGWKQMGRDSFVMDVFFYDEATREVEEQSTGETAIVDWHPKPETPDPRQTNLPLEARVNRRF